MHYFAILSVKESHVLSSYLLYDYITLSLRGHNYMPLCNNIGKTYKNATERRIALPVLVLATKSCCHALLKGRHLSY